MDPIFGVISSVQPHVRLTRSFDQREFEHLGFLVAVGQREQLILSVTDALVHHHQLQAGRLITAEYASSRRFPGLHGEITAVKTASGPSTKTKPPPYHVVPPDLAKYEEAGCRRLPEKAYGDKCATCIWAARMPTTMIVDHWNPSNRDYRDETFCYGPLKCRAYRSGPKRRVPGRKGMEYIEENWVDEDATGNRDEE